MVPFYLMLNKLLEWKLRLTQAQCLWSEKLKCISRGLAFTNKINIYIMQTGTHVTHYCCPNAFPRLLVPAKEAVETDALSLKGQIDPHGLCASPPRRTCSRPCWKSKPLIGCWAPCNLHQTATVASHRLCNGEESPDLSIWLVNLILLMKREWQERWGWNWTHRPVTLRNSLLLNSKKDILSKEVALKKSVLNFVSYLFFFCLITVSLNWMCITTLSSITNK